MSLTWSDLTTKAVRLSRDISPATLAQLQQDMNTGYHMFNAKFGRYYSRKQQFTNVKVNESIYQTPIDSVRILGMTVKTATGTNSYSPPIKEIRSEYEWRLIKTTPNYASSWIAYYYVLGKDEVEVWPVPSGDITNGIRFYYQPQDHDLSVSDIVSGSLTPVQTATVTNGETLVTSTGSTFTSQLVGLQFQLTGVTDLSWYEIVEVPTSSTLTLKSAFVGNSGALQSFRIGQIAITPQEYADAPVHYALGNFFYSKGNTQRGDYHLGRDEEGKRGVFYSMIQDATQAYSSSTEGNVISDSDNFISPWVLTPLPGITP
jgi:hypothetical protein